MIINGATVRYTGVAFTTIDNHVELRSDLQVECYLSLYIKRVKCV